MLKVLQAGFYSTIQDLGRFGYRDIGVPVSGVMDSYSSQFANALLGNTKNAAIIEMTMIGGKFQFTEPTSIVVAGADMQPTVNSKLVEQHKVINIKKDDVLKCNVASNGFRTYIAVKGGFKTKKLLGSRSLYVPVTAQSYLHKNNELAYEPCVDANTSFSKIKFQKNYLETDVLEVYKGVEFEQLSKEQKHRLFSNCFTVSKNNNRMAYQLEPIIKNSLVPILSSPVLPGTVQLTPNGNLIVLMRDCQTTGGYPRVLQLTERAINTLAQKTFRNTLKFRLKE